MVTAVAASGLPSRRFHYLGFLPRQPGPRRSLPVLPADAVVLEYGRPVVFVERAPGQFERRAVATGARAESLVAITRGVQAGERIVVDGAVLLRGR